MSGWPSAGWWQVPQHSAPLHPAVYDRESTAGVRLALGEGLSPCRFLCCPSHRDGDQAHWPSSSLKENLSAVSLLDPSRVTFYQGEKAPSLVF